MNEVITNKEGGKEGRDRRERERERVEARYANKLDCTLSS